MNEFCTNRVIALASRITKGHCSKVEAKVIYSILKLLYKELDVPYEVENNTTESYMFELYDTVQMGVTSEAIILHMAEIAENLYPKRIKRSLIVRCAITAGVIGCIIFAICVN